MKQETPVNAFARAYGGQATPNAHTIVGEIHRTHWRSNGHQNVIWFSDLGWCDGPFFRWQNPMCAKVCFALMEGNPFSNVIYCLAFGRLPGDYLGYFSKKNDGIVRLANVFFGVSSAA